jgi:hypothetical protein
MIQKNKLKWQIRVKEDLSGRGQTEKLMLRDLSPC